MYTGGIFERGHRSQDSAVRERKRILYGKKNEKKKYALVGSPF